MMIPAPRHPVRQLGIRTSGTIPSADWIAEVSTPVDYWPVEDGSEAGARGQCRRLPGRSGLFVDLDVLGVGQRDPDVVQPFEQSPTGVVVDVEGVRYPV